MERKSERIRIVACVPLRFVSRLSAENFLQFLEISGQITTKLSNFLSTDITPQDSVAGNNIVNNLY
jgi:hypothetical protein